MVAYMECALIAFENDQNETNNSSHSASSSLANGHSHTIPEDIVSLMETRLARGGLRYSGVPNTIASVGSSKNFLIIPKLFLNKAFLFLFSMATVVVLR